LVRKWIGSECTGASSVPVSAVRPARNMIAKQQHSTPKRLSLPEEKASMHEDDIAIVRTPSTESRSKTSKSTTSEVNDSVASAAGNSPAGKSSLTALLLNGLSSYLEDEDADYNGEDDKTSGNESLEFRSVTDSDLDNSDLRSAPLGEEALHIEESEKDKDQDQDKDQDKDNSRS